MKKLLITVALVGVTVLTGCSAKTRLLAGASTVRALTPAIQANLVCENTGTLLIEDKHPRNINKDTVNEVFLSGSTHYKITSISQVDYKNRPTGYSVDTYICK